MSSAAQCSVEHINTEGDILPNYTLSLVRGNSGSTEETIVSYVENIAYSTLESQGCVIGMVGPAISQEDPVSILSSLANRVTISHIHLSTSPLLQNRDVYANSYGIVGSQLDLTEAVISMVKHQNWENVVLFYDSDNKLYKQSIERFTKQLSGRIALRAIGQSRVHLDDTRRVVIVMAGAPLVCELLWDAIDKRVVYPVFQLIVVGLKYKQLSLYDECQVDKLQALLNGLLLVSFDFNIDTAISINNDSECIHVHGCFDQHWATSGDSNCDTISLVYDSILALALAVNETLGFYNTSPCGDERFNSLVSSNLAADKPFSGLSGSIKFDSTTGYNKRRVNIFQVSNRTVEVIGHFYKFNDSLSLFNNNNLINTTLGIQLESVRIEVASLFTLITLLQLFVISALQVLTIVHRKHKSIRASNSKLNHSVFIGCYIIIITLLLFLWPYKTLPVLEGRAQICLVFNLWLLPISISLIFAPLITHVWRLYRIFTHFDRPGCCLSNNALCGIVGLQVCVDLLIGTLSTVFAPAEVSLSRTGRVSPDGKVIVSPMCRQGSQELWLLVWVYKYTQVFALFVLSCFTNVKMNKNFSTSRFKIGSYLIIVLSTTLLPLYLFLWITDADIHADVVVMCILGNSFLLLCTLFILLPPVMEVLRKRNKTKINSFSSAVLL